VALAEDIELLEKLLRQLQVDWEKFFGGVERKPPMELRTKVESLIRRYANGEIRNNTERFRYQTMTARYSSMNELWNKRLRALEEGRPLGVHGHRLPPPVAPLAAVPEPPARATPAPPAANSEYRVRDAAADAESVRALFERFAEARMQTGEPPVKYENFQKLIGNQASKILADKGALAVNFRIETKDGKVSLKARAVR
jgi:hypothetical protein